MPHIDVIAQRLIIDFLHLIDLNLSLSQEEPHPKERWKQVAAARHTVHRAAKFIHEHPEDPSRVLERAFWTGDDEGCPCPSCKAYDVYRASNCWTTMADLVRLIKSDWDRSDWEKVDWEKMMKASETEEAVLKKPPESVSEGEG